MNDQPKEQRSQTYGNPANWTLVAGHGEIVTSASFRWDNDKIVGMQWTFANGTSCTAGDYERNYGTLSSYHFNAGANGYVLDTMDLGVSTWGGDAPTFAWISLHEMS